MQPPSDLLKSLFKMSKMGIKNTTEKICSEKISVPNKGTINVV